MIECKIYEFKTEFCGELNIPPYQVNRRQSELLTWLTNYFDFELLVGRPLRILIKKIYGEYQQMPRKIPSQEKLTQEKKEKYEAFTVEALGTEFKPNSKTKIARDAIKSFGQQDFGHQNFKAVSERYIKEPFEKYGETNDNWLWVWYSSYKPLSIDEIERWRHILREENIAEEQAANAFYKAAEGEDISKEIGFYKMAQERMKSEFAGDFPVRVREWKARKSEI